MVEFDLERVFDEDDHLYFYARDQDSARLTIESRRMVVLATA
jgi:hypothetical protein